VNIKDLSIAALIIFYCFASNSQAMGLRRTDPTSPSSPPVSTPISTPTPVAVATPIPTAAPVASATPAPVSGATLTPTCTSSDPAHLCIGLKLVSYSQNGSPSLTEAQAIALVNGINQVWNQCNIAFQLEKYVSVDPTTLNLEYNTDWKANAGNVRAAFNENNSFLVVAVGSLSGATIAVTEMPGGGPYGTLVEQEFATNPLTVGHELGHYQGLYHVSDTTNLMDPYIGPNTSGLSTSQCAIAHTTDAAYWQAMMRY
jgi:hypothetical protein